MRVLINGVEYDKASADKKLADIIKYLGSFPPGTGHGIPSVRLQQEMHDDLVEALKTKKSIGCVVIMKD